MTGGTIIGLVALATMLLLCAGALLFGLATFIGDRRSYDPERRGLVIAAGAVGVAAISVGVWWWAMAFTLSGDYHRWNVKSGTVRKVSKRLVPAGENSMQERFVLVVGGVPYGVDDTRAALVKPGDRVSLRCKKDYQWGVPRDAHGWACRWNGPAA